MSDSRHPLPTAADIPLISPVKDPSSALVRIGGLFGLLGCVLGLAGMLAGCAGYGNALAVSPVVIGLGALGLIVSLLGPVFEHRKIGEDTHVMQALFACLLAIIGGVLEMAVWRDWHIFK